MDTGRIVVSKNWLECWSLAKDGWNYVGGFYQKQLIVDVEYPLLRLRRYIDSELENTIGSN